MKRGLQAYKWSCIYAGSIVLGWDLQSIQIERRREERGGALSRKFKEQAWQVAEDLTLALAWPITGPPAVKRALANMEFGPFDDDE